MGAVPAGPSELEPLLAAMLEAEHTLVLGSDLTHADLQPLLLLLPPRLRSELTVHTNARAVPPGPLPRLLITPLTDEQPFWSDAGSWVHRLPRTQPELSVHARDLAAELLALLTMPERLAEAHEAYERYIERCAALRSGPPAAARLSRPRHSLAAEAERLLRFARMAAARSDGEPRSALRVLGQAAAGGQDDAWQTELAYLVDLLRDGFAPTSIGAAVAGVIRDPRMPAAALALVMERMLAERSDPNRSWSAGAAADEFRGSLKSLGGAGSEGGAPVGSAGGDWDEGGASSEAEARQRIATMLMLSAAADGDPIPFAAALARHDVDGEQIGRLGGVEAWAAPDEPAFAAALHALSAAPPDAVRALEALAALRHRVSPKEALALVDAGVACVRRCFRATAAEEWESALPLAAAVLRLCEAVTSSGITLDGRSASELLDDMLHRAASANRAPSFDDHTAAEILLGLLGAGASRSRVAIWEIPAKGDALVRATMQRIRDDAGDAGRGTEAVHWGMALLDRAWRHEVDPRYAELAKKLLEAAVGPAAPDLLRAFDRRPTPHPVGGGEPGDSASVQRDRETRPEPPISAPPAIVRTERPTSRPKRSGGADERLSRLVQPDGLRTATSPGGSRGASGPQRPRSPRARPRARLAGLAKDVENPWRRVWAARHSRTGVQVVRTAAALVVVGGLVAAAILVRRGAGGATPAEARATASETDVAAAGARSSTAATKATEAEPGFAEVLADAKAWAAAEEWDRVIAMLSDGGPDWTEPESFAWDSLLARAALRQAQRLPAGEARRRVLLGSARDRATLALASVAPFAEGSDLLRLVRAEACIIGELACESATLTEDLLLAARSPHVAVSERAAELLESVKP